MKLENILKWFPAIAGVILFLTGLILKIVEKPAGYDQFISGNSYILLVIGIEAVILNFAFNSILSDNSDSQNKS
jgi:ABC-type uncharacterized transport system permease subunit